MQNKTCVIIGTSRVRSAHAGAGSGLLAPPIQATSLRAAHIDVSAHATRFQPGESADEPSASLGDTAAARIGHARASSCCAAGR